MCGRFAFHAASAGYPVDHTHTTGDGLRIELETAKVRAKTRPYDASRCLKTEEGMALYLEEGLKTGDSKLVAIAFENITHAKNSSPSLTT